MADTILGVRKANEDMAFTIILYRGKKFEDGTANQEDVNFLQRVEEVTQRAFSKEVHIVHAYEDVRWHGDLYRDAIHPSPEGNEVLARIIAEAIKSR